MRSILPVLAAMLLGSCSIFAPRLETPRLSIVNVEMQEGGLWEQRLKVRMRVQNPNERTLPIKGLSYTLEVAGEDFARGVSAAAFTVPALGEAEFDMNVTANMASALVRLLGKGDESLTDAVDYRLVGKVSLAEGMLRSIPFEERGTFKLR
ncbi:MAG TPA: LEA type 2 family protein [Steroidobacteraceae bacterium]|nr:LEA type 2 family protein [Steroidobacteraceae bacterium]